MWRDPTARSRPHDVQVRGRLTLASWFEGIKAQRTFGTDRTAGVPRRRRARHGRGDCAQRIGSHATEGQGGCRLDRAAQTLEDRGERKRRGRSESGRGSAASSHWRRPSIFRQADGLPRAPPVRRHATSATAMRSRNRALSTSCATASGSHRRRTRSSWLTSSTPCGRASMVSAPAGARPRSARIQSGASIRPGRCTWTSRAAAASQLCLSPWGAGNGEGGGNGFTRRNGATETNRDDGLIRRQVSGGCRPETRHMDREHRRITSAISSGHGARDSRFSRSMCAASGRRPPERIPLRSSPFLRFSVWTRSSRPFPCLSILRMRCPPQ